MEKDKVSIIVPMYNCENYIEQLLKSIVNQTYSNIEVILVDDGSTDNTLIKCKKFSSDKRVKIYSQKNSGVSAARNKGISKSNGKYIYFSDSDDYIELDTIEKMVSTYKKNKVDLVIAGFFSEVIASDGVIQLSDKIFFKEKKYSSMKEIRNDFVELWDKHILYNIWNKLYLSKIIKENDIKFPNYNWGEDIDFNRNYLLNISSMYNMSECFYHYIRARNNSATEKYIENLFEIRKKEYYEFCDYFDKYGIKADDYKEFVARRHIERLVGCIENIAKSGSKKRFLDKIKITRKIINDELTRICLRDAKLQSKKMKILIIPVKFKLSLIALFMGKILSFIKTKFPKIFNMMKNRR